MSSVTNQGDSTIAVVPWNRHPVTNVCSVHFGTFRHPLESRSGRVTKTFCFGLDESKTVGIAHVVLDLTHPSHGHVKDPSLGVVRSIRHTGDC